MTAGTIHERAIFVPELPGYPEEKWGWTGPGALGREGNENSGFYFWQSQKEGISKKFDTLVTPNARVRVLVNIKSIETPSARVQVLGVISAAWPITDRYGLFSLYVQANQNGEVILRINLEDKGAFRLNTVEVWAPA